MTRHMHGSRALHTLAALAVCATFSAAVPSYSMGADRPVPDKLVRQIGVMEKVLDQVLLDSPNLLVYSREASRGLYLDGYGAVFTLEASLVNKGDKKKWGLGDFKFKEEDGKIVIDLKDLKDKTEGDEQSWREQRIAADRELYEKGKAELVNAILDYGETLSGLDGSEWVAVAAFLKDSDYFLSNRISRLVIRARMSDLRALSAGRISADEMRSRLVEEEY